MYSSNKEFQENIINKYLQDINNIYMIQDYIILESIEECDKIISEIFKDDNTDNKLIDKKRGNFSFLINEKYLLIAKNNELKDIFNIIYKFMLILSKNISKNEIFIITNIKEILSIINLILIFNDNVTFYSLKKKILLLILSKNEKKNLDELITSEYYFTCVKNKKGRKSLISWDYKYFLYTNFKNNIKHKKDENNKSFKILNLLKDEINLIGIKENIFCNKEFILNDLEIIDEINTVESRNYHMWTYLRKVFNDIDKEGKIIIILYAFLLLRKSSFDYSAFSFIVNSKKSIPLNKEQLLSLVKEMKKACIIKYEQHKCYIDNIEKYIIN